MRNIACSYVWKTSFLYAVCVMASGGWKVHKIGVVCSLFNGEITGRMLETALHRAGERHALVVAVERVPGAFEIPFAVQKLLKRKDVEGVVALGAVIKGETAHDEVITHAVAQKLLDLSLGFNKPVSLGVGGPQMTYAMAKARIVPYSMGAVDAVLEVLSHHEKFAAGTHAPAKKFKKVFGSRSSRKKVSSRPNSKGKKGRRLFFA